MARARILVADDHSDMRQMVVELLEREFEVLDALGDGQAMVEAASRLKPDVCLLDISMPVLNGIEAARALRQSGSTAKIIFLTIHEDKAYLQAALESGASGYVIKRCLATDLRPAVTEVLAGNTFVSSSLAMSEN